MSDMVVSVKCECGNDIWEIDGKEAVCTNCFHRRPFHSRSVIPHHITPSQQAKIDQIKKYFCSFINGAEPARFEVTTSEYGYVTVIIETTTNLRTVQGGMFFIYQKGRTELTMVYDLGTGTDANSEVGKMYAKSLGAKVK